MEKLVILVIIGFDQYLFSGVNRDEVISLGLTTYVADEERGTSGPGHIFLSARRLTNY
jgi:hypothetical protein